METYEGTMTIKWYKNDNGDTRPLTLGVKDEKELNTIKERIKQDFLTLGDDPTLPNPKNIGRVAYSVHFRLTKRQ
ncbi:MAG: hypothetical protein Q4G08_04105 [Capnocytophaga sp.]|nr:hypothetical protein [Capnocytophaga sp.]